MIDINHIILNTAAFKKRMRTLRKIPRLIKNMIPVLPHPITSEHSRKAQAFWYVLFRNPVITAFRLVDDELPDLHRESSSASNHLLVRYGMEWSVHLPATPYP